MVSRRAIMRAGAMSGLATAATASVAVAARGSSPAPTAPHRHATPPAHPGRHMTVGTAGSVAAAGDPFSVSLPVPPVLAPIASVGSTDLYRLTTRRGHAELLPGVRTEIIGYDGRYVGPTIRTRPGRLALVTHVNQLDMPVAAHLHGGHVPATSDGFPTDTVSPGHSRIYRYPNRQRAATLWYHDHAHHMEAEHVYRGLHGFYLIDDPADNALRLPGGEYDVPIMLTDARFGEDGSLVFEEDDFQFRTTILANGKVRPYFRVAARRYRFRLLNAANLRTFVLRVGNDTEFTQIASDGGLLPAPVGLRSLRLTPAERAEIVVDFSRFPVGSQVYLEDAQGGPVIRFDVTRTAADRSRVPDRLTTLPALPEPTVRREVTLGLDPATFTFRVNGKLFDPERVDTEIKLGATEVWSITNTDVAFGIPHNFHPHLVQFRVLDRNGTPPQPGEAGLKDTVSVGPGETVRIQATFGDYTGRYVYHCHFIDHSSTGMMAQMRIMP